MKPLLLCVAVGLAGCSKPIGCGVVKRVTPGTFDDRYRTAVVDLGKGSVVLNYAYGLQEGDRVCLKDGIDGIQVMVPEAER